MTTDTAHVRLTGRRVMVLVVLLAAQFMLAADFSVLNVALPRVGADLGFLSGDLQWITTTFALCAAGCTLMFGRVGDHLGRRRIFAAGMAVLAAASAVGGLAGSPAVLLVARTLQGLATAAVTPAALALLTAAFPEPSLRTKALGLNGVMMSSGFTVGSILGGLLTDLLSWRWAFFLNLPVALAALAVVPLVVPESRAETRRKPDVPGAVLITTGLFAGVYGITRAAESGLDTAAVFSLALAAVLLIAFGIVESRTADPLVPAAILRHPDVAYGNVAALFLFGGETALIFFTGLYVQNVLGHSSLVAGMVLVGIGAGQILGGSIGPRILAKVRPRTLLGVALVGQGAFMLPGLWLAATNGWLAVLIAAEFANAVFSMLAMLSFLVLATSAAGADAQGLATGMATQSQQIGMAIGIPLASAVFTTVTTGELDAIRAAIGVDALALVGAGAFGLLRRGKR
ncbi:MULTISPECIES: MFS transporter [Amycolatopsis]|uniref:MFS transporter n=1 Tax=Amycolatopsis dendrobii TaxID=2760662 RepID=A0A7W3W004_9PSEU|nr:MULTISPECIES: MFS transporter [Amycolatopsis]MBB1156235.1 MFS transporter [Amycolatopsis dendrobii]UKD58761.1 MFS transporter [Amycolatopsis sp. FU40]